MSKRLQYWVSAFGFGLGVLLMVVSGIAFIGFIHQPSEFDRVAAGTGSFVCGVMFGAGTSLFWDFMNTIMDIIQGERESDE